MDLAPILVPMPDSTPRTVSPFGIGLLVVALLAILFAIYLVAQRGAAGLGEEAEQIESVE